MKLLSCGVIDDNDCVKFNVIANYGDFWQFIVILKIVAVKVETNGTSNCINFLQFFDVKHRII